MRRKKRNSFCGPQWHEAVQTVCAQAVKRRSQLHRTLWHRPPFCHSEAEQESPQQPALTSRPLLTQRLILLWKMIGPDDLWRSLLI